MYCLKCGGPLEDGAKYCFNCGNEIDESLDITFEDPEEVVEDPIILESHTFSEDEELPKLIDEELKKEEPKKSNPVMVLLFVFLFLGVIGGVGGYVFIPLLFPKTEPVLRKIVLSDQLDSGEVSINGEILSLNKPYSHFENRGFSIDSSLITKDSEAVLSKKERTSIDYSFYRSSLRGVKMFVGFYNPLDESNIISKCNIYGIRVEYDKEDSNIDFMLPGNIKMHSTVSEIMEQYGEILEDDIKTFTDEGYTIYHYDKEGSYSLDLYIYDDGGLLGFQYEVV